MMDEIDRCPAIHNPGVWPYAARCTRPVGHPGDDITGTGGISVHIDAQSRTWPVTTPSLPLPTPGDTKCHRADIHHPHSWINEREGKGDSRPWWVRIEECPGVSA